MLRSRCFTAATAKTDKMDDPSLKLFVWTLRTRPHPHSRNLTHTLPNKIKTNQGAEMVEESDLESMTGRKKEKKAKGKGKGKKVISRMLLY